MDVNDLSVFQIIGITVVLVISTCLFCLILYMFKMFWCFLVPCRACYEIGKRCDPDKELCGDDTII